MKHAEFVTKHAEGLADASIDRSAAMEVCDKDPRIGKRARLTHMFWSNLCLIALFAGPLSIIWFPWQYGVAVFVLVGLGGGAIVRTVASGFVRKAALEDAAFYQDMMRDEVMTVRSRKGSAAG